LKPQQLFAASNYIGAAVAYEQIIFETSDLETKNSLLLKKADCFDLIRDYINFDKTLARITLEKQADALVAEVYLKRAMANYNIKQFKNADYFLAKLNAINPSKDQHLSAYLLQALIDIELEHFFQSYANLKSYFLEVDGIVDYQRALAIKKIDSLFSKENIPKMKSLKTARRLSFFLPGGGLHYLGEPVRGFSNGLLQASMLAYMAYNFAQLNFVTGTLAGGKFFLQVYFGSVNQLNELVEDKNSESKRKFNFVLKDLILQYAK
jgi:hypothetical protein